MSRSLQSFVVLARSLAMVITTSVGSARAFSSAEEASLWVEILNGQVVVMMRHALAPGVGDPDDFSLDDCRTQRNLSERGRQQAMQIGERFRDNGIVVADVYTSQWCRCRETAELLDLGVVNDLPPLNSFFRNRSRGPQQTADVLQWLSVREDRKPLVLVTHMVNILELTGQTLSSGEMIVFRLQSDHSVSIIGRIKTSF